MNIQSEVVLTPPVVDGCSFRKKKHETTVKFSRRGKIIIKKTGRKPLVPSLSHNSPVPMAKAQDEIYITGLAGLDLDF